MKLKQLYLEPSTSSGRVSRRGKSKATPSCVAGCICLCHEGCGDVEHLGRPCYGKPGSTDTSDFDRNPATT